MLYAGAAAGVTFPALVTGIGLYVAGLGAGRGGGGAGLGAGLGAGAGLGSDELTLNTYFWYLG
jgi:hypothetical protein